MISFLGDMLGPIDIDAICKIIVDRVNEFEKSKQMTPEELVKLFKSTLESESIQLDNLDRAKLVFDEETGEVVVENEHATQFPVSDLSDNEMKIFAYLLSSEKPFT